MLLQQRSHRLNVTTNEACRRPDMQGPQQMLEHQVPPPDGHFPGLFPQSSLPGSRKRTETKPRMAAIRALTKRQLAAIRVAMRHRVDEDLARGRSLAER